MKPNASILLRCRRGWRTWFTCARFDASRLTRRLRRYRRSAEQGNASAQNNLGNMYAYGNGVVQNFVQAHKWYNLAASRFGTSDRDGRDTAVRNRDRVASRLSPTEIAEAQRLAPEHHLHTPLSCRTRHGPGPPAGRRFPLESRARTRSWRLLRAGRHSCPPPFAPIPAPLRDPTSGAPKRGPPSPARSRRLSPCPGSARSRGGRRPRSGAARRCCPGNTPRPRWRRFAARCRTSEGNAAPEFVPEWRGLRSGSGSLPGSSLRLRRSGRRRSRSPGSRRPLLPPRCERSRGSTRWTRERRTFGSPSMPANAAASRALPPPLAPAPDRPAPSQSHPGSETPRSGIPIPSGARMSWTSRPRSAHRGSCSEAAQG